MSITANLPHEFHPGRPKDSRKGEGSARLVSKGANDGAENHGGAKARNEKAADVAAVKAVVLVQRVHIGALQPVASCTQDAQLMSAQQI